MSFNTTCALTLRLTSSGVRRNTVGLHVWRTRVYRSWRATGVFHGLFHPPLPGYLSRPAVVKISPIFTGRPTVHKSNMKTITLNTGAEMPVLGYGTLEISPEDAVTSVKLALDVGYKHVDCASIYLNQKGVGKAFSAAFQTGGYKREDIFITSKIWSTQLRRDLVKKAIQETLTDLQLTYLDLYLIHWPVALKEGGEDYPMEDGKMCYSHTDWLDTWKEMEKLVDEGLVRAIGVSNFNSEQVQRVLDNCRIKPAVNQVEVQPMLNQQKLIDFCHSRGIKMTAYSPLGSPGRPDALPTDPRPMEDPTVLAIAAKYGKTAAQVLLRYPIQRGIVVLAKSITPSRMKENLDVFDFELSEEDMASLNSMDIGLRAEPANCFKECKTHPFTIPF